MNDWNEGYFTESTYTYGYYGELNPVYQRFCLLVNGIYPPESDNNSVHCELGYGQGVSINIHATANLGRYIGTDFNPSQAAHANELLRASGSPSVFYDDSFEELLERDLPQFDSISLHGIWAWVTPENQKHIVEFARRFLKPGGIFYNSYNCFPGWAPNAPMREILFMYDKYAHQSTNTHKRVEEAIKFTEELLAANPKYLKNAPNMQSYFEQVRKQNKDYLAHEYFNSEWRCMYFTDMVDFLQSAKLDFACISDPLETIDQFILTKEATDFLRKIENPIMREQTRDYFVNRQFRKDIYIRGIRRMPDTEKTRRLLEMRYVHVSTEEFTLEFKVPTGNAHLPEQPYRLMEEYLKADNGKPKDFLQFSKEHPEIKPNELIGALIVLVHRGLIQPCQSEEAASSVKPKCDRLNAYLCKRAMYSGDITTLASPVTGGGIGVDRFGQMLLYAYKQGNQDSDAVARSVWEIISSQGQKMIVNQKSLETEEENIAYIKVKAQRFQEKVLPILKALQIA